MAPIFRNFAITLFGKIHQVIVGEAAPANFGLPAPHKPLLDEFSLQDAFEGGEPDLFRALRWDHGLVETLYGRKDDLAAIKAWANSGGNTASVRLVTGEGGIGKTRLAAAAARELKEEGWTAGFLPHSDTAQFEAGKKKLFLILDYPEEQMMLKRWRFIATWRRRAPMPSAPIWRCPSTTCRLF